MGTGTLPAQAENHSGKMCSLGAKTIMPQRTCQWLGEHMGIMGMFHLKTVQEWHACSPHGWEDQVCYCCCCHRWSCSGSSGRSKGMLSKYIGGRIFFILTRSFWAQRLRSQIDCGRVKLAVVRCGLLALCIATSHSL